MLSQLETRLVGLVIELGDGEITGRDLRRRYNDRYPPTLFGLQLSTSWFGLSVISFYMIMRQLEEEGYVRSREANDAVGPLRYYRRGELPLTAA